MAGPLKNLVKTIGAVLVGTVGGPIALAAWFVAVNLHDGTGALVGIFDPPGSLLTIWLATTVFALLFGTPLMLFLQDIGSTGYFVTAGSGALCGMALIFLISGPAGTEKGMGALAAFAVASIAWLIRRPDRDRSRDAQPSAS